MKNKYFIGIALFAICIAIASFVHAGIYSAPSYDNVTLILESDYTAPSYTNVTLILGVPPPVNTAPYNITIHDINSKANNSNISDSTPLINFTAYDREQSSMSCELYVNGTAGYGINSTTLNATATQLEVNQTLSDGSYTTYVNCSDGSLVNVSDIWYFTVDATIIVNITYPQNSTTYDANVSELNYTYIEAHPDSCWYSTDGGASNSSAVSMGTNFTDITSIGGSNTWTVYCNDTFGNENSSSVTFIVNELWYNPGYPYANKSFRITEFINVSGSNFTLAGEQYRFIGADSYYLADYATNHTYDDDGNEINNSRKAVLEILNEAQYLNINVIRTWAGMQGGVGSHWLQNKSGGHWNLFEVNTPGNYSEDMFKALDWVIYEASKRDIRLQLVLVNNWNDYGGMRWYAQQSPTTNKTYENVSEDEDPTYYWSEFHDQFYDDENCRQYFRNYINHTLNRNNTYSGLLYKDDPAIFSWLLGNEPRAKSDGTGRGLIRNWTINMTAYIKSIDTNHLVGLGIEGWGYNETWGEGTDMIADHNGTGVDYTTFALHPDQWQYFAARSEHAGGGLVTEGTGTPAYVDWWTNDTGLSYNNKDHLTDPWYIPDLARYGYDNWVAQNVKWSNDLGMPILLQEAGYLTNHTKVIKDRFYEQMIHNFYNEGGDGLMFWTLNHDDYYYSTDINGTMDDGYGFYLSDDPFLKNKSQSVLDAINFTKYDNNGDSWIRELSNYRYDFVLNIGWASDTVISNCTLNLNISNDTVWTNYYVDQVNTTPIILNEDYTFTKLFNTTDVEAYWYTQCHGDTTFINSTEAHIQLRIAIPIIVLISPDDDETLNIWVIDFVYNVTETDGLEISNCELYIDDVLNKTDYTVEREVNQTFTVTFPTALATYNWSIKCIDIDNNIGYSETRNFTILTQCFPVLNEDWVIIDAQVCDNVEVTTGTGSINVTAIGNLTLINAANVTTTKMYILGTGDKVFIHSGCEIRVG